MNRMIMVAVSLLLCNYWAFGQHRISGVVMDADSHEPLVGVSIMDIQSRTGTVTQLNGKFTLEIKNKQDSLLITYTGYLDRRMPVRDSNLVISLRPSLTALNELVVTASRTAEKRTEVPVAISVISPEMIRQTKPVTLDQVLNKVSGVYMVNLGNEQHTMDIRQPIGFGSNYLYLEDGIPIRTVGDFNHNALIEINQADVDRIEVVKGPSSSLYGSDAVGGAVNFISKKPSLVPDAELTLEGSNWGYRRADLSASNTFNKTGVLISGYYADDYGSYMTHDNFHKLALTARIDQQLTKRSTLTGEATWIHYYTDMNGGLDSAHFFGQNYNTLYTFTYRKVEAWRARVTWQQDYSERSHSQLTFYYRNNAEGQNPFYRISTTSDPLKANGEINDNFFQSYGLLGQYDQKIPLWRSHILAGIQIEANPAGLNAHYIAIDRNAAGFFTDYRLTDSLLTDYRVNILGTAAYAQLQTSPFENLRIVAGVRYDGLNYNFKNHLPPSAFSGSPDGVSHFNQITPKIGVTYDLGDDRGLYANYSVGFAPPDMSDLYSGVKIPYLQPARFFNYEAGGWMSFDNHKGYADLSVYRMNGKNEIISVRQADGYETEQNAGRTLHTGVEYEVKYKPIPQWSLRVSGTNVRHRFINYIQNGKDYNGNEMADAPHWIMNTEVTYAPGYLKGLTASIEWQHISAYYMDPANTQQYPGYDLFNARVNYSWKRLEFWAKLDNGLNTRYATMAQKSGSNVTYYPGLLRTLYVGIGYHFSGKPGN